MQKGAASMEPWLRSGRLVSTALSPADGHWQNHNWLFWNRIVKDILHPVPHDLTKHTGRKVQRTNPPNPVDVLTARGKKLFLGHFGQQSPGAAAGEDFVSGEREVCTYVLHLSWTGPHPGQRAEWSR